MTIKELESLQRSLIVTENTSKDHLNLSGLFTAMIKKASQCERFASDILYDIDALKADISALENGETFSRYLGYRKNGIDHTAFIKCRTISDYQAMQYLIVSMVNDMITIDLFELEVNL